MPAATQNAAAPPKVSGRGITRGRRKMKSATSPIDNPRISASPAARIAQLNVSPLLPSPSTSASSTGSKNINGAAAASPTSAAIGNAARGAPAERARPALANPSGGSTASSSSCAPGAPNPAARIVNAMLAANPPKNIDGFDSSVASGWNKKALNTNPANNPRLRPLNRLSDVSMSEPNEPYAIIGAITIAAAMSAGRSALPSSRG